MLTVLALALVLTAASVAFLSRPRGPNVALALSWEEGSTHRYRIEIGMDGDAVLDGREIPLTADLKEVVRVTVLDVDPTGATTLETEVERVTGTFDGIPIPPDLGRMPPYRMTVTADGRVVTEDGLTIPIPTSGPGSGNPLGGMFPLFPDHPVGPGDTWEISYRQPIPFGRGAIEIDSENSFLRYHDAAGTQVAVIESRVSSPFAFDIDTQRLAEHLSEADPALASESPPRVVIRYEGSMDGRQIAWVDPAGGQLVKVAVEADIDMATELIEAPGARGAHEVAFSGQVTTSLDRL